MIPYDPHATHVHWFQIWRNFVRSVHNLPDSAELARQACFAQMKYVTHAAIAVVEHDY